LHLKDILFDNNSATGSSYGGAVYVDASDDKIAVENCTFTNNSAEQGGAILSYSPILITGSMIKDNTASNYGGGIFFGPNATAYIYNTTIESNTANTGGMGVGGGVYNNGALITFEACTVLHNVSTNGSGGGIYVCSSADHPRTTLKRSIIKDNISGIDGGGAYTEGNLYIERCLISGNTAEANGGGIYYFNSGSGEVTNSVFIGNKAAANGGGLVYDYGAVNDNWLHIYNCTFVTNEAVNYGSAMFIPHSDEMQVVNCIFRNNMNVVGGATVLMRELWVDNSPPLALEDSNYQPGALHTLYVTPNTGCTTEVPVFVSYPSNLRLANSCPTTIKTGGNDDTQFLVPDYAGNLRISPNSMGAYRQ
jgi:parallel beta-helix repeat protein/predicted outer membrane repeat protein